MKVAGLIVGVCLLLTLVGSPVGAQPNKENCKNGVDDTGNGLIDCADPDCSSKGFCSDGNTGPDNSLYDGAVGHDLDCLPCTPNLSCIEGDFHDLGVVDMENGCRPLECGGLNQSVTCGRRGDGRPRIDINGLIATWPGDGQGNPGVCFGDGIVEPALHNENSGPAGQIQIRMFYTGMVDYSGVTPGLPARCAGVTDLFRYVVNIDGCTTAGTFPPTDTTATITCGSGSQVSFSTEGGGGIAQKCGCKATFGLANATEIHLDPQ